MIKKLRKHSYECNYCNDVMSLMTDLKLSHVDRIIVLLNVFYLCIAVDLHPSYLLDNIQVMVIVWRLRGNIIRTAVCWIVSHNVHSHQHTYEQFLQVKQIGFVTLGPLRCV